MLHTTSQEKVTKIVPFPRFLACCDGTCDRRTSRMVLFWRGEHRDMWEKK